MSNLVLALVVLVPAAAILLAAAHLLDGNPHRIAWILAGLAGAPAFAAGVVYVFGMPFIGAAFVLGILVSAHRRFHALPPVIYALGFVAAAVVVASRFDTSRGDRVGISLFLASAFLAMHCVTRIGRATGATIGRIAHRT
jgi:hypothetical protein